MMINNIFIYIFCFGTIFLPNKYTNFKMVVVLIFLASIILFLFKNKNRVKLDKFTFSWFLSYIIINTAYIAYSVFSNNLNALNLVTLNIINPAIYYLLIVYAKNEKIETKILNISKNIVIITAFYNILFFIVINFFPFIDSNLFIGIRSNIGGLDIGFIKITTQTLIPLAFFSGLSSCSLLCSKNKKEKTKDLTILFLGVINAIISARTAFLISVALLPVIIIILLKYFNNIDTKIIFKILKIILVSVLVIGIVFFIFNIDFSLLLEKILQSFNTTTQVGLNDSGGILRKEQLIALIQTWEQRPLFGWGESAEAIGIIRGSNGAYELTYFALLMQRGMIGVLIFFSQLVVIFYSVKKTCNKNAISILVGLIVLLIINATNPTFQSFDGLFLFFFIFLFIEKGDNKIENFSNNTNI